MLYKHNVYRLTRKLLKKIYGKFMYLTNFEGGLLGTSEYHVKLVII